MPKNKILIVGTVPYNNHTQSRAMISYLSNYADNVSLAQFFSNGEKPNISIYKTLFQITDKMVLFDRIKHPFCRTANLGNILDFEFREDKGANYQKNGSSFLSFFKTNKGAFMKLMRKKLWSKKYWEKNKKLNEWADNFKPDLIYLCFSNDFFILRIALYFAKKYNIPIVSQISDDYYFNDKFSLSPFYHIYKVMYKKLFKNVLSWKGGTFYICDNAKKRYDKEFLNPSKVFYISSDLKPVSNVSFDSKRLVYTGGLYLGRYKALLSVANALQKVNASFLIDVYSSTKNVKIVRAISKHPLINFKGNIPYQEVIKVSQLSRLNLVVENPKSKDVIHTRYSLSTKVADLLSLGVPILAYGSEKSGAIDYLKTNNCAFVANDESSLVSILQKALFDKEMNFDKIRRAKKIASLNHNKTATSNDFECFVEKILLSK